MAVCMETAHLAVILQKMFNVLAVQMVTIWVPVITVTVVSINNVHVPLIMVAQVVFLGTLIRVTIAKKVALVTVSNVQAMPSVPNVLPENMVNRVN